MLAQSGRPEVRYQGVTPSPEALESSLASSSFWWWSALPALFGLWPHHPNLHLHLHLIFPSVFSSVSLCPGYKDTCHWL